MKQLDFAGKIGMSTSILGQIERGTRIPTIEQLDTMALVLHIEVKELMGETNSQGKEG
jgi:transcriptional regulator with XRE-family HTH domain